MEILLNTIWLLLGIGAISFWQRELGATGWRYRQQARWSLVAFVCALVLLFPVISLTDDLHAEQAAIEDSSRSVMKAQSLTIACLSAGKRVSSAQAAALTLSVAVGYLFFGTVCSIALLPRGLTPISSHHGRSPPSGM